MKSKKAWVWRLPLIIVVCAIFLSPFIVLINISFKPITDVSSRLLFSKTPTLENFSAAIHEGGIFPALMNTLFITFCVIFLIVAIGSLASYPLARNRSRFNRGIRNFILGVMMVPPLSILVPLYSVLVDIGGINQYWGIVLVIVTFELPLAIFLYSNFIASIPRALDEAAQIDGCNPIQTFFLIILPQLKSVTASVVILVGMHSWNDYQFSLYVLQSTKMRTVTLAISSFFSQTTSNLYAASSAALVATVPMIVCFLFLQKYFIKGMVDSAIK